MVVCEKALCRVVAMMTHRCGIVTRASWNRNIAIFSCKNYVNAVAIRPSFMLLPSLCCAIAVESWPSV